MIDSKPSDSRGLFLPMSLIFSYVVFKAKPERCIFFVKRLGTAMQIFNGGWGGNKYEYFEPKTGCGIFGDMYSNS